MPKISKPVPSLTQKTILFILITLYALSTTISTIYFVLQANISKNQIGILTAHLLTTQKAYQALKDEDQYKINQQLKKDIDNTHTSYTSLINAFEGIQDLKTQKQNTGKLEDSYVTIVKDLSDLKYASAESKLATLSGQIKKINDDLAAAAAAAASANLASAPNGQATASNTAPSGGFGYQSVKTGIGDFTVSIVAADLNSTRVIIDTASDSDCHDNCPVLSLGDYAGRNGAFAGVNGSYFCPASYPSCAGKTNSFDTLLMNKNKHYFNSDNNVYSTVPVAVFGSGFARFLGQSSGWGRDTSVDGVIANQPLLLSGGNIAFTGGSDPKQGGKGTRSFIGNKGSTVYIGVVYNATVAEVAYALKALGLENALNLDSGGSTALWYGGYKVGPGRNIPNAVLFARK
jgi:exopolysaccharide biosynthesis protein